MYIRVIVIDPSQPTWNSIGDVYRPRLSTYSPIAASEHDMIEHVDLVTTWKGLSFQQAVELRYWQEGFQRALETIVEEALVDRFDREGIPLDLDSGDAHETILRMYNLVNTLGRKKLKVPLETLVNNMQFHHSTRHPSSTWLSSKDFMQGSQGGIVNFIQTLQCFRQRQDGHYGTSIQDHEANLSVHFSAKTSLTLDRLDIFANIVSETHRLSMTRDENGELQIAFNDIFQPTSSELKVDPNSGDVYHVSNTTPFPNNVDFERCFRIRLHITAAQLQPRNDSPFEEPSQRDPIRLGVPRLNPIRDISDFEKNAANHHRQVYETHRNISNQTVFKASMIDRIYGAPNPLKQYNEESFWAMPVQVPETTATELLQFMPNTAKRPSGAEPARHISSLDTPRNLSGSEAAKGLIAAVKRGESVDVSREDGIALLDWIDECLFDCKESDKEHVESERDGSNVGEEGDSSFSMVELQDLKVTKRWRDSVDDYSDAD